MNMERKIKKVNKKTLKTLDKAKVLKKVIFVHTLSSDYDPSTDRYKAAIVEYEAHGLVTKYTKTEINNDSILSDDIQLTIGKNELRFELDIAKDKIVYWNKEYQIVNYSEEYDVLIIQLRKDK